MAKTKNPAVTDPQMLAVNLAALAREISMDLFPTKTIIELHRLSDEEWAQIQANRNFQEMLQSMTLEWNSATNTKQRVKAKAATGLEMHLEHLVLAIADEDIPLIQRVEAGKFLARLGELDGQREGMNGERFNITLNIGSSTQSIDVAPRPGVTIEHEA